MSEIVDKDLIQEIQELVETIVQADEQTSFSELAKLGGLDPLNDFAGAYLGEIDLSGENLKGANFSGTNLSQANLSGADLSNANLSKANLNQTNLTGTNLSHANLTNAELNDAILNDTNLSEANLKGTILETNNQQESLESEQKNNLMSKLGRVEIDEDEVIDHSSTSEEIVMEDVINKEPEEIQKTAISLKQRKGIYRQQKRQIWNALTWPQQIMHYCELMIVEDENEQPYLICVIQLSHIFTILMESSFRQLELMELAKEHSDVSHVGFQLKGKYEFLFPIELIPILKQEVELNGRTILERYYNMPEFKHILDLNFFSDHDNE